MFPSHIMLGALVNFIAVVNAGKTQTITNWGDNPSNLGGVLVYTPDKIAEKPAVILGVSVLDSHYIVQYLRCV
jgi:acetylxylan esterase